MADPRIFLVHPAAVTVGVSFIPPRWPFVLASATPIELCGDPILVDETIERFDPKRVRAGDIVGIGITTDNALAGYNVLRRAKERGAIVVMGGIHCHRTMFPDEPITMGADAVVSGNADVIWKQVIKDILSGKLQRHYDGGMLPGDLLLRARWDLMVRSGYENRYLFPSVQTIAGCPENCSFCSVWITEGRSPRQRLVDKIVDEVNELNAMGFPAIMFADDNFNPATLGRIARETSPSKRRELERIREERLAFFEEYARRVDRRIPAFTQMTSEVVSDPEYLRAMRDKMGVRGALIGVESFTEVGLKSIRKDWNPTGKAMAEVIEKVQTAGIQVLVSIICGLEPDTTATLRTMREFAKASGPRFAQFPLYRPFPGTVDFREMEHDPGKKHKTRLINNRYWLDPRRPRVVIEHPNMTAETLLLNIEESWSGFYDPLEIVRRASKVPWPFTGKVVLILASLAFRVLYAGRGISGDSARQEELDFAPRILLRIAALLLRRYAVRRRKREQQQRPLPLPKAA